MWIFEETGSVGNLKKSDRSRSGPCTENIALVAYSVAEGPSTSILWLLRNKNVNMVFNILTT